MVSLRHVSAFLALLVTAGSAVAQVAQAAQADWVSYRDAYRAMVVFEKYGKAKNFIQNHLQVIARERGVSSDGVQLTLHSKSVSLNVPVDATGRAVLPMLKSVYQENGTLLLNRKASQYKFRPRLSIVVRQDGVYEAADLRTACEQALAYERHIDSSLRATRCTGVRFVFPQGAADAIVKLRNGSGAALPTTTGPAFQGDAYERFQLVQYRFEAGEKNQLTTPNAPLAINPVYE